MGNLMKAAEMDRVEATVKENMAVTANLPNRARVEHAAPGANILSQTRCVAYPQQSNLLGDAYSKSHRRLANLLWCRLHVRQRWQLLEASRHQ